MTRLSRVTFWLLTAVAIVTFAVLLRQMAYSMSFEHLYILAVFLISQGLMIWCLRDLYRRRFSEDRTKLSIWFAALLLLGVLGTTAYAICVKQRQWIA